MCISVRLSLGLQFSTIARLYRHTTSKNLATPLCLKHWFYGLHQRHPGSISNFWKVSQALRNGSSLASGRNAWDCWLFVQLSPSGAVAFSGTNSTLAGPGLMLDLVNGFCLISLYSLWSSRPYNRQIGSNNSFSMMNKFSWTNKNKFGLCLLVITVI